MTIWHSLYWTSKAVVTPTPSKLAADLQAAGEAAGYTPYNPFGLMPAPLYDATIKLFVAPTDERWGRVLCGELPPADVLAAASGGRVIVALSLEGDTLTVRAFGDGAPADDVTAALRPFVSDAARLGRLLTGDTQPGDLPDDIDDTGGTVGVVPTDALPPEMREMAAGLDAGAMDKMFRRIAGGAFKGRGDADAAADLLQSSVGPDWNSDGGRRARGLLDVLAGGGPTPDFVTLRDAYALHARRQRKPDARLYPGDRESMDAVPDALDYTPVFMGKDDDVV
jgi:hypothetical protein